jgi:U3 small nucleolar RNA-associated protein 18
MAPISKFRNSRVAVKGREESPSSSAAYNGAHDEVADDSGKDSTEEELERLIFGDSSGFQKGLKSITQVDQREEGKELVLAGGDLDEGHTGLENVDDANVCYSVYVVYIYYKLISRFLQLFFLDSGPSDSPNQALFTAQTSDDEDGSTREQAAWSDSDDDMISVSLAARPQLKKLRRTEAEDVISGKEYSRRLRKQCVMRLILPALITV